MFAKLPKFYILLHMQNIIHVGLWRNWTEVMTHFMILFNLSSACSNKFMSLVLQCFAGIVNNGGNNVTLIRSIVAYMYSSHTMYCNLHCSKDAFMLYIFQVVWDRK